MTAPDLVAEAIATATNSINGEAIMTPQEARAEARETAVYLLLEHFAACRPHAEDMPSDECLNDLAAKIVRAVDARSEVQKERFELVEPHLGDKHASDWTCRRLPDGLNAIVDFVTSSELDPDALRPGMIIECRHTHAYIEIAVGATIVEPGPA